MPAGTAPPATALAALEAELVDLLGARNVTSDLRARERASVDGARMSPIITELLPLGVADLVAWPTTAADIGRVMQQLGAVINSSAETGQSTVKSNVGVIGG